MEEGQIVRAFHSVLAATGFLEVLGVVEGDLNGYVGGEVADQMGFESG